MQAVILKSRKELAFEEVSDPKLENSNQLLVDIKATGICGTDLELYQHGGVEYPRILGHEIAGEVSQVGDNIETYQVGDKVVIHPLSYFITLHNRTLENQFAIHRNSNKVIFEIVNRVFGRFDRTHMLYSNCIIRLRRISSFLPTASCGVSRGDPL